MQPREKAFLFALYAPLCGKNSGGFCGGEGAGFDFPAVQIAGEFAGPVFFGAGHEDLAAGVVGAFQ